MSCGSPPESTEALEVWAGARSRCHHTFAEVSSASLVGDAGRAGARALPLRDRGFVRPHGCRAQRTTAGARRARRRCIHADRPDSSSGNSRPAPRRSHAQLDHRGHRGRTHQGARHHAEPAPGHRLQGGRGRPGPLGGVRHEPQPRRGARPHLRDDAEDHRRAPAAVPDRRDVRRGHPQDAGRGLPQGRPDPWRRPRDRAAAAGPGPDVHARPAGQGRRHRGPALGPRGRRLAARRRCRHAGRRGAATRTTSTTTP